MKFSDIQSGGTGDSGKLNAKLVIIKVAILLIFIIYALHLYSMQVANGEYFCISSSSSQIIVCFFKKYSAA